MSWKTSSTWHASWLVRWLVVAALLGNLGSSLCGCDLLAGWRDSQVRQSSAAATAGKVVPPQQPVKIPKNLERALPVPEGATVVSFLDGGGVASIHLISPVDTLETCNWMLGRLQQLGYDSGDNPSRVLEGVEFHNARARYPRLYVEVSLNTHDQCTIELQAYENE